MFGKKNICHDQEILDEEMQNESKYGIFTKIRDVDQ